MSITLNNHPKYRVGFCRRISLEKQTDTIPFIDFGLTYYGCKPENQKITAEEIARLNKIETEYIKVLQVQSGPLNPTYIDDKNNFYLEDQTANLPPPITEEMKTLGRKLDDNIIEKYDMAKEILENKTGKDLNVLYDKVMTTDSDSPEFVKRIIDANEYLVNGINAEINTESGRLDEIVNSDEATIFVANHDNPPYDASLAFLFYSELYKKYEEAGKTNNIPMPKLIADSRTVNGFPDKLKEIFKKVEAVPVIATSYPTQESSKFNNQVINPVVYDFINDKNHILIYPEGRRNKFRQTLPLEERFQYGIGKIIQTALKHKSRVKVVPLGMAYKDGLGSIYIGKPIYFEKDDNNIRVKGGNITPDTEPYKSNSFYREMARLPEGENQVICHNGVPVSTTGNINNKFMSRLIAGILCTDMDICAKNSKDKLNNDVAS